MIFYYLCRKNVRRMKRYLTLLAAVWLLAGCAEPPENGGRHALRLDPAAAQHRGRHRRRGLPDRGARTGRGQPRDVRADTQAVCRTQPGPHDLQRRADRLRTVAAPKTRRARQGRLPEPGHRTPGRVVCTHARRRREARACTRHRPPRLDLAAGTVDHGPQRLRSDPCRMARLDEIHAQPREAAGAAARTRPAHGPRRSRRAEWTISSSTTLP